MFPGGCFCYLRKGLLAKPSLHSKQSTAQKIGKKVRVCQKHFAGKHTGHNLSKVRIKFKNARR